jgi:hypothetical protein
MTIGELEPEFVSYATLRRHTFCFKGMKRCEFDHDPTDSRTLPILTPAPRTVTCSTVARLSARFVPPPQIASARSFHSSGWAHMYVSCWVRWELAIHSACVTVFMYPWMIPSACAACACAVVPNASAEPLHVCSGGVSFRIFFVYSFG